MTTTTPSFFSDERNAAIVRGFLVTLRSIPPSVTLNPDVVPTLTQFFEVLAANTNHFDQHCAVNIEWIGRHFISTLENFSSQPQEKYQEALNSIFTLAYRFLCELDFTQTGELSFELRRMREFVEKNLEGFAGIDRQQLVYANYVMPVNVTKHLIQNPAIADFRSFQETVASANALRDEWDKEIKKKNDEINALKANIDRVTTTYNFVGIVKGFESLADTKKEEKRRAFFSILGLGALMLAPVLFQVFLIGTTIGTTETLKTGLLLSLPATLTLEIILIYFFRVVLGQFRAVTAQLMQIELRISLCQFIQNYAEYSAKIKSKDASALEKFETLIFSGIVSNNDALPSTLDGVEQLAKLIKSVRGQ